jgi:hypothetical protein
VECGAEEKCLPPDESKTGLDAEEAQPHTDTGSPDIREQPVERTQDAGALVNENFDRHDHATDRHPCAKGHNASTEEARDNDEHEAEEEVETMDTEEHDRSNRAVVGASELLRRARANSQDKRDLAVRIFSTAATTSDRQEISIQKGVLQVAILDHEPGRIDELPRDHSDTATTHGLASDLHHGSLNDTTLGSASLSTDTNESIVINTTTTQDNY